jgi:hypothetical protein
MVGSSEPAEEGGSSGVEANGDVEIAEPDSGNDIYASMLRAGYRGCVVASMACADYPAASCYMQEIIPLVDEQKSKGGPCVQELNDFATCLGTLVVSDIQCLHPGVLAPKCGAQRNTFMMCNQ